LFGTPSWFQYSCGPWFLLK